MLLNLLHGALGVERVEDDLVLVEAGEVRDALAGVFGGARELERLGEVESRRVPDLCQKISFPSASRESGITDSC